MRCCFDQQFTRPGHFNYGRIWRWREGTKAIGCAAHKILNFLIWIGFDQQSNLDFYLSWHTRQHGDAGIQYVAHLEGGHRQGGWFDI